MSKNDITATSRESKAAVPAKTSNYQPPAPIVRRNDVPAVPSAYAFIKERLDLIVKLDDVRDPDNVPALREIVPQLPKLREQWAELDQPVSAELIYEVCRQIARGKALAGNIDPDVFHTNLCELVTEKRPNNYECLRMSRLVLGSKSPFASIPEALEALEKARKEVLYRLRRALEPDRLEENLEWSEREAEKRKNAAEIERRGERCQIILELRRKHEAEKEWAKLKERHGGDLDSMYENPITWSRLRDLAEFVPQARDLVRRVDREWRLRVLQRSSPSEGVSLGVTLGSDEALDLLDKIASSDDEEGGVR